MRRLSRLLLYSGTIVVVFGMAKLHAAQAASARYDFTASPRLWWTAFFAAVLSLAAFSSGLPDLVVGRRTIAFAATVATIAGAIGVSLAQLTLGAALLPRFVVFGSIAVLAPFYVLCAALSDDGRSRAIDRDRTIVIGDWAVAAELSDELERAPERPARIIDVLTPAEAMRTLSGELPLCEMARMGNATVVVLDRVAQLDRSIVEQAGVLHAEGVRIRTLSLFYEEWLGKLPISELERVSLMFDIGELHRVRYGRLKRMIDLAFATVGLVALTAALPFVMIGNLIANHGSLMFRQQRVGRGAQPITILKFRTMRGASDGAGEWTEVNDPRITPFGKVLRRTHIDELPQVLNILRGDLSLVGPRPEQLHYVGELSQKLPFYSLRHLVRPGLTGWAQVKYPYAASDADAMEKLQYEFYYLRHQGLLFDMKIVTRTVRTVVLGVNK
ncbi:MAG: sugar transferase [Acidimicrobiales bacterium]